MHFSSPRQDMVPEQAQRNQGEPKGCDLKKIERKGSFS
jgi:hypothetical protein